MNLSLNVVVAWVIALLVPAFLLVAFVVQLDETGNAVWSTTVAFVLTGWVGAFLVAKAPKNRIGWLLSLGAIVGGFAGIGAAIVPSTEIPLQAPPDLAPAEILIGFVGGTIGWFGILFVWLIGVPWLFPTGKPTTPRWRWVGWLGASALTLIVVLSIFDTELCDTWKMVDQSTPGAVTEVEQCFDNPIGMTRLPDAEGGVVGGMLIAGAIVAAVGALASLVVRFRSAETTERNQIKWVLFSFSLVVSTLVIETILEAILGDGALASTEWVAGLVWAMFPLSIGVAILKYRLYDIDRLIRRTATYALVVGALAAVFFAAVTLVTVLLPTQNALAVAVSTLAVAALFNPLRSRIKRSVDHRFNRSRYAAQQIIEEFTDTLQNQVELDRIIGGLLEVAIDSIEPAAAGIWVKSPSTRTRPHP